MPCSKRIFHLYDGTASIMVENRQAVPGGNSQPTADCYKVSHVEPERKPAWFGLELTAKTLATNIYRYNKWAPLWLPQAQVKNVRYFYKPVARAELSFRRINSILYIAIVIIAFPQRHVREEGLQMDDLEFHTLTQKINQT